MTYRQLYNITTSQQAMLSLQMYKITYAVNAISSVYTNMIHLCNQCSSLLSHLLCQKKNLICIAVVKSHLSYLK